jgi:hypothetical protein
MPPDTKSMRDAIDALPGDRVAFMKDDLRHLLDFVDIGSAAERKLAAISGVIIAPAVLA